MFLGRISIRIVWVWTLSLISKSEIHVEFIIQSGGEFCLFYFILFLIFKLLLRLVINCESRVGGWRQLVENEADQLLKLLKMRLKKLPVICWLFGSNRVFGFIRLKSILPKGQRPRTWDTGRPWASWPICEFHRS